MQQKMYKRRWLSSSRPAPANVAALLAAVALLSYSRTVFVAQAAPRTSSKPTALVPNIRPVLQRGSGIYETTPVLQILGGIVALGIASRGLSSKPGLKVSAKVTVGCWASSGTSLSGSIPAAAFVDHSVSSDLLSLSHSTTAPLVLREPVGQNFFAYVEATLGAPARSESQEPAAVAAFGSSTASASLLVACRRAGKSRLRASRNDRRSSYAAGATQRGQRRHIGSKLKAVDPSSPALILSYDASLVRKKIQLGLQCASTHPSSEHARERGNIHASDGLRMAAESCVAGYSFTVQHRLFRNSLLLRSEPDMVRLVWWKWSLP